MPLEYCSHVFFTYLLDNTLITCDVPAICPGEIVSCTCITAHSNTLAWSSDQLIGEDGAELVLNLNDPLLARQNASNMNTFAVLSNTSDENGVLVLKSELSFVLLSTSFSIILTCENIDDQNSHSVILPIYSKYVYSCIHEIYWLVSYHPVGGGSGGRGGDGGWGGTPPERPSFPPPKLYNKINS